MARSAGPGNPYRILYWFGAVLVVLVAGVVYLGSRSPAPKGPVRTAIWLTEPDRQPNERRDLVLLVEERPEGGTIMVVFPARLEGRLLLPGADGGRQAAADLQQVLGYRIRHYLVIPAGVMAQMADYGPRLTAPDQPPLDGAAAVAYLFGAGDPAEQMERAAILLPQFFDNAFSGRLDIGLAEARRLLGRIEGNLGALDLAERGQAWFSAGVPPLDPAPGAFAADGGWRLDRDGLGSLLHPDPADAAGAR